MARSKWVYTGDIREGIAYQMRPGVERDRYAHPDELVWRYLPLNRFEQVLRTRKLFFTRLSYYATHADRLEGSTPRPIPDAREQMLREQGIDIDHYNGEAGRLHLQMLQPSSSAAGISVSTNPYRCGNGMVEARMQSQSSQRSTG